MIKNHHTKKRLDVNHGSKDVATLAETEVNEAGTGDDVADGLNLQRHVLDTVMNQTAIIAMVRQRLDTLISELHDLRGVNRSHIQPIIAATCVLESVEEKLDELSGLLIPTDEAYQAAREMMANEKK